MSDYYYKIFRDISQSEKHDIIIQLLTEVIIPNVNLTDVGWLDIISNGYFQAKQYKLSAEWGEQALLICTDVTQAYYCKSNLSKTYLYTNQPEKTLELVDENLKVNFLDNEMNLNKVVALYSLNRKQESRDIAFKLKDSDTLTAQERVKVLYNLGIHYLTDGEFQMGMQHLQMGRAVGIWGQPYHSNFPMPMWDGIPKLNKSILFVGEGGIGDEFIYSRFCKQVRQMGMIPHFSSGHNITTPFLRMGFESAISHQDLVKDQSLISKFDYWLAIMDAPIVLNLDFCDLWSGPYITVDSNFNKKWQEILPKSDKMKIGIKWKGNPLYEEALHRDLPVTEIVSLIDRDKFEIVSLQKEHSEELINDDSIIQLSKKLETIEDLIAAIEQLDVIVTSCTSIAHISAAMGKPTYVFVPIMNYLIWAEPGSKSSWYGDNVHVLRQQTIRSWIEPIKEFNQIIQNLN